MKGTVVGPADKRVLVKVPKWWRNVHVYCEGMHPDRGETLYFALKDDWSFKLSGELLPGGYRSEEMSLVDQAGIMLQGIELTWNDKFKRYLQGPGSQTFAQKMEKLTTALQQEKLETVIRAASDWLTWTETDLNEAKRLPYGKDLPYFREQAHALYDILTMQE